MSADRHPSPKQNAVAQQLWNWGLIAVLWLILCLQLSDEWSLNDQYNYGLFVPFIGLYLLHLRWLDRPETTQGKTPTWPLAVFAAVALLHYPLKIIFEANADWRFAAWTQAMLVLAATYALILRWGGGPWLRHFWIPFAFLLTAVPWPTIIEKELVRWLMQIVATATVEVVNLLGVHARQAGNTIYLTNGIVSVEEACSGIRSFQSTITAGIMLGELLRFTAAIRWLLISIAASLALFFNFCRTLLLTWLSAEKGTGYMAEWHDFAGLSVFIASFAALVLLAYLFHRRYPNHEWQAAMHKRTRHPFSPVFTPAYLSVTSVVLLGLLLTGSVPAVHAWYALRQPVDYTQNSWDIDWSKNSLNLKHQEISPQIQNILHYKRGEHVTWDSPEGIHWLAYLFFWDEARSAQLGGVHNPEICLPATGWKLTHKGEDFSWKDERGVELVFNSYEFSSTKTDIHVFYCQWDLMGYPYHTKSGRMREDRLRDAWIGDRKEGKQKLEIVLQGAKSLEAAKVELIRFLERSIVIKPPER